MIAVPAADRGKTGGAVPVQGPCPRATGETTMETLSRDLPGPWTPGAEVELAQRVRALRRARRDARTRAARVRRALLAPTPGGDRFAARPARTIRRTW